MNYKYNFNISNKARVESGLPLDANDMFIIEFINDWVKSGKAISDKNIDNMKCYWISTKLIMTNVKLFELRTLQRRLKALVDMKIIIPHPDNKKDQKTYYALTSLFYSLTYDNNDASTTTKLTQGNDKNDARPMSNLTQPYDNIDATPTTELSHYNTNNNIINIDYNNNNDYNNNDNKEKEKKKKQITDLPFYFQFVEIIDFYYSITNTKPRIPIEYDRFVKYQSYKSIALALKENPDVTIQEIKNMLTYKSQMLSDPIMKEHYVIETLFRNSNFNKYLQQTSTAQNQYSNNFKQLSYEQRTKSTLEQFKQQIRDDEQRNQKKYF